MILMIDNYDSFTYNVVQYLGILGVEVKVVRNDALSLEDIAKMAPQAIVISPGPCTPNEAGISVDVVRRFSGQIPILGVCLGHQSIAHAFGATVHRAGRIMHGKTSPIVHHGSGVFADIPSPFAATRYHSLSVDRDTLPPELIVTATASDDGEVMGLMHTQHPTWGVQFHPEAILTEHGLQLLGNFVTMGDASCR
jgi:anthranilate synthase/aminodeoxychorismate synthase-like glutamine amidotransferase